MKQHIRSDKGYEYGSLTTEFKKAL